MVAIVEAANEVEAGAVVPHDPTFKAKQGQKSMLWVLGHSEKQTDLMTTARSRYGSKKKRGD